MSDFTSIINTRVQPKTKVQLIHEAEQRQLKLSQLIRLALVEWLTIQRLLAIQREVSMPVQRRHDDSSDGTVA